MCNQVQPGPLPHLGGARAQTGLPAKSSDWVFSPGCTRVPLSSQGYRGAGAHTGTPLGWTTPTSPLDKHWIWALMLELERSCQSIGGSKKGVFLF